jgi:hypothetical protein
MGWKGRGLGPFTSAQPAAGPLLSSQLVWPQTTQNSRSLGDPGHANEHLWSVARPLRAADAVRLPTDLGPPTCRTRLALSGVDRYGGGNVGWESMHRQLSAASPGEPVGRPAVASGPGSSVSCGVAATLRRCGHTGWNTAPEVWRETWRLLLRHGEQAPAVSGTKSSSCLCGGCQATGPPRFPAPQRLRNALVSKAEASRPAGERALWHCVCPPSSSSGLAPGRH